MKQKLGRKLLSFLLTLAMFVGMLSGMSLTAYAEEKSVTLTPSSASSEPISSEGWRSLGGSWLITGDIIIKSTAGNITKIILSEGSFYEGRLTQYVGVTPGNVTAGSGRLVVTDINSTEVTLSCIYNLFSSVSSVVVYYDDTTTVTTHAEVTNVPSPMSLIYNGSAQELVIAGEATGGTMQYAIGADGNTVPTEGWSTSIPTATDAGTYYVWYMAKGDDTHNDSDPGVVSVTIKENTEAHTHTFKLVEAKEPTCTDNGYGSYYECPDCGAWFEDGNGHHQLSETEKAEIVKKATGHKWDNGEVTKEPTYDEEGIKTYTCKNDPSHTKEETIPKKTRSSSSDSSDSSDSDSSGGSSGYSGSVSKQILDVNGNAVAGSSGNLQPDSGMPVSDRGGSWGGAANIWSYIKSDGALARNEWLNLEYNGHTYWYYFNDGALMQTDWLNLNGATYYFVPEGDGWRGRMATGWQQIGEKWYYFEPTAGIYQGVMYRGAITPDGHIVGADGAWNGVGATPVGQK